MLALSIVLPVAAILFLSSLTRATFGFGSFYAHLAGLVLQDLKLIGNMVVNDLETMIAGLPPTEMLGAEPEFIKHLTKKW